VARQVLFHHEGRDGTIEVIQESAGVRSLHFGTVSKQSSLDPEAPHQLVLPYTRTLTTGLVFVAEPRRVLLVGLGGGALAQFFLHHFPSVQVEAVENWPRVVEVARDYFDLPVADPRLTIHHADAAAFLADPARHPAEGWDLIIGDAYGAEGPAEDTVAAAFYEYCHAALAEGGVFSANLWSSHRRRLQAALRTLEAVFGRPVYRLQPRGRANVAALAGKPPLPEGDLGRYHRRARQLERATGIDYPRYLGDMQVVRKGWLPSLGV